MNVGKSGQVMLINIDKAVEAGVVETTNIGLASYGLGEDLIKSREEALQSKHR